MLNRVKTRFLIGVGGLIAVSFMVMIGLQSVSKQSENQIRAEANKLVTKERRKERQSYQMGLSKNFSLNITPKFS